MKHYDFEVSQFIDNELSVPEQKVLFAHLAQCEECSAFLTDSMNLKKQINTHYLDMNAESGSINALMNRINTRNKQNNYYKISFAISMAATLILGFFLAITQHNRSQAEERYFSLRSEVETLKENISILAVEKQKQESPVNASIQKVKRISQVKLKPENVTRNTKEDVKPQKGIEMSVPDRYTSQYASIQKVSISKEDFLVQKMVGN